MSLRQVGLLLLLLALATAAEAVTPSETVAQATRAFLSGDGVALQTLVASTGNAAASKNPDEVLAATFVQFRRAQWSVGAKDNTALKSAGERCVTLAAAVVALDAKSADAFALQSACYGYLATLGGFGAISNGRKSGKAMDAALALEPRNPRVVLVDAISYTFRPRIAGGDKAKAYTRAQEAATLFDTNKPGTALLAGWGPAEAWYWVGRGAEHAGNTTAARQAYERALALEPAFAAARRKLANR